MIGHLPHWLNTELWGPIWPNTIAPSAWTLAAVVISHVKSARQRDRQQASADAAHRIAADLFEHHTGRRHPAAPADSGIEAK